MGFHVDIESHFLAEAGVREVLTAVALFEHDSFAAAAAEKALDDFRRPRVQAVLGSLPKGGRERVRLREAAAGFWGPV